MKSLISVIVPVYNVKNFLCKCIESVLNQTYKNFEIILVDDGSTDGSAELCDYYAEIENKVCVIHKKNGGVSSARNIGINNAKGDYIFFIDGDDWIESNSLEYLYSLSKNRDIIYGGYIIENINGKKIINIVIEKKYSTYDELFFDCCKNLSGFAPNKLYSRKIIGETRFDECISMCEDLKFNFDIMCKNPSFVSCSELLYHYVMRPGSALHQKFDEKKIDGAKVWDYIMSHTGKNNLMMYNRYTFYMVSSMTYMLRSNPNIKFYNYFRNRIVINYRKCILENSIKFRILAILYKNFPFVPALVIVNLLYYIQKVFLFKWRNV